MGRGDRRLVKRMLAGDGAAFEQFFDDHFPGLYRFALTRVDHDADVADEVVQATICKAIDRLESYRGEAALFSWLCMICRNLITDHHRRTQRRPQWVELQVDSRGSPGSIEIRTALGTARDVGTRFEVRLGDGALRVRVRDGVVEVDHAGETHEAGAGAELTLDAAGTPARRRGERSRSTGRSGAGAWRSPPPSTSRGAA